MSAAQLTTLVRPPTLGANLPMLNTERLLPHLGVQNWLDYPGQPRAPLAFPSAFLHALIDHKPLVLPRELRQTMLMAYIAIQHTNNIEAVIDHLGGGMDYQEAMKTGALYDLSLAVANHLMVFSRSLKTSDDEVFARMTETSLAALITAHSHVGSERHWRRIRDIVEMHPGYVHSLTRLRHLPKGVFPSAWFIEKATPCPLYWVLTRWALMPNEQTERQTWMDLVQRAAHEPDAAVVALAMDPTNPQALQWRTRIIHEPRLAFEAAAILHRWTGDDVWRTHAESLRAAVLKDARYAYHWFRDIEPGPIASFVLSALTPALEWMLQYAVDAHVHPDFLLRAMDTMTGHPLDPCIREWIRRQLNPR